MLASSHSLTEEQALLARTARDFFSERSPASRVRELRDSRDSVGFSWELWRAMAELGWVGSHLPEAHGGSGLGFLELCLVLEAAGRSLAPEPLLSTSLLAAELLQRSGNAALAGVWLPAIARGDCALAVAYQERKSRYDLRRIESQARRDAGGFRVTGEKVQVLDGHVAKALIVSARTEKGVGLFVVERTAPGVSVTRQHRIDGRNAALVVLDGAKGESLHGGADLLERVLDLAAIGISFEMLGSATRAFELTLEHLKTRYQFGVPIGSFQALQHRAARLYVELSLARSAAHAAARAADQNSEQLARLASLAKARCSDGFLRVANEAVQMHGGIGVTDEHDIGLYLKRARAADVSFGDAAWHRERWAVLGGY